MGCLFSSETLGKHVHWTRPQPLSVCLNAYAAQHLKIENDSNTPPRPSKRKWYTFLIDDSKCYAHMTWVLSPSRDLDCNELSSLVDDKNCPLRRWSFIAFCYRAHIFREKRWSLLISTSLFISFCCKIISEDNWFSKNTAQTSIVRQVQKYWIAIPTRRKWPCYMSMLLVDDVKHYSESGSSQNQCS